ncbi:hypothetical protein GCM10010170_041830 [Dactylosporangium salmoneum]|uniref:Uncharacterized protein n=1 Tax=Dactylosporangium salmoneum TaxID=53361 RepID=A0ABP5TFQ8_9ACTN
MNNNDMTARGGSAGAGGASSARSATYRCPRAPEHHAVAVPMLYESGRTHIDGTAARPRWRTRPVDGSGASRDGAVCGAGAAGPAAVMAAACSRGGRRGRVVRVLGVRYRRFAI